MESGASFSGGGWVCLLQHGQFPARGLVPRKLALLSHLKVSPHIGSSERVWGVRSSFFFSVSQKHVKLQRRPTQPSNRPRLLWSTSLQCQIALFGGRWKFWRGSLSRNQRWLLGFWSEQRWENEGSRMGSFLERKTGSQLPFKMRRKQRLKRHSPYPRTQSLRERDVNSQYQYNVWSSCPRTATGVTGEVGQKRKGFCSVFQNNFRLT